MTSVAVRLAKGTQGPSFKEIILPAKVAVCTPENDARWDAVTKKKARKRMAKIGKYFCRSNTFMSL